MYRTVMQITSFQASVGAGGGLPVRLYATDARLLKAIEDALARIRAGTLGN